MFCTPSFSLTDWFLSPVLVIPSKFLKNFICAASSLCSSHFFSTQASLPNFKAALAVILWIPKFVFSHLFSKMASHDTIYFFMCLYLIFQITFVIRYEVSSLLVLLY
jgi:hypothetical protein